MGIHKRKNSPYWYIRIKTPCGRRIRSSTKTEDKKLAERLHDKIKHDLWEIKNLNKKPDRSWKEAVVRWAKEKAHKRSLNNDLEHIRWLEPHLGDFNIAEITRDSVESIAQAKEKFGAAPGTVNKMLQVIRGILRAAKLSWEWVDDIPAIRMRPETPGVVRWITQEEAARLLKELPDHLRKMAIFSLATGLRAENVKMLKWKHVYIESRHAFVPLTKSGKPLAVPLNDMALGVLEECRGDDETFVFVYGGHPVKQTSTKAWWGALERAEIKNFRWHDLRHTWASWHVQNGTSLHELQQLGGWSSYKMVLRYAHLSSHQLRSAADRISGTFLAHNECRDQYKVGV